MRAFATCGARSITIFRRERCGGNDEISVAADDDGPYFPRDNGPICSTRNRLVGNHGVTLMRGDDGR